MATKISSWLTDDLQANVVPTPVTLNLVRPSECREAKATLPRHTRNLGPIMHILFRLCKGMEVGNPSVTIIFPCHIISTVFARVDRSNTWPNRLLALLRVINEGVLRRVPPSRKARSATTADVTKEHTTIPPKAKIKPPHERY